MAATAKKAFDKTLERVDGLLALHPLMHGIPGRPQQHVSDVLRGALVLATAALDALVLDSMAEAIPRLAKAGKLGQGVAKWVKDAPADILACFAETDPCAALGLFCRGELGPLTFQRAKPIEGAMRDILGCDPPWDRAAVALSANGKKKWTGDLVSERLDVFVQRRNRIAHAGDLKEGTATQLIQLRYLKEAVAVIRAVGAAVTEVVDARVKVRR